MSTGPGEAISRAIRAQRAAVGGPALIPFVTAGFPSKRAFAGVLDSVAPHAAAIEVGVPFSDPMADGVTIQRTSRVALEQGVDLDWILTEVSRARGRFAVPIVLMGYLNPFLRYGLSRLAAACAEVGVEGLIIPDMPLEESGPVRGALHGQGVGLVQLVSPATSAERAARIAAASDGFLYAVTIAGVTGGAVSPSTSPAYLGRMRGVSPVPVCAGFGVRSGADVNALRDSSDGVIVGSALAEAIEAGEDPGDWLGRLRG
jgi:tryptophan synthase alpha chain